MFLPEFKINTFFITALLTILGYSINDTIVVFDKIRSNIKKLIKKKTLAEIIEISVSETLRRSIFTSLTLFFVLLTIFFF
jgi:preprotein translocase SecF subunit